MAVVGGLTTEREATEETQELCDQLRDNIESLVQTTFAEFKAIKFSSQVVAGVNFFIKIHVGEGDHIHIRVFKPLPHTGEPPKVHGYETGKTLEDPIKYIQKS